MKIFDSAKETNKIQYSVDVEGMIFDGSMSESRLDSYLQQMLGGRFGSVPEAQARRFSKHIDTGDLDIYGIYGDIMVYYDAQYDTVTFLTQDEFRNFYGPDWTNPARKGFSTRYGAERQNIKTGKFVKWNQTRAIIQKIQEELKKNSEKGSYDQTRLDYKTFPHQNLQAVVKVLKKTNVDRTMPSGEEYSGDAYNYLRTLLKDDPQKLRNALLLFGYQHHVQHKNTADSLKYVENALRADVAALGAKDEAPEKPDYSKTTAQGYKVLELWESDTGRKFVIMKRNRDYAFGAGYDLSDGTWAAGYYDYDSAINARQAMYLQYPYNEFKRVRA